MSGSALDLFQKHSDQSWHELKNLLFQNFPVKLSIRDKVEVRKKLFQNDGESVDDFYQRCLQAQYLVSDDMRDAGFEREVLLHFLIGLTPFIRDLVLATKCSSTNEYIIEANKYDQIVKEEPIEANVKIETDEEYDVDVNMSLEDSMEQDEYETFESESTSKSDDYKQTNKTKHYKSKQNKKHKTEENLDSLDTESKQMDNVCTYPGCNKSFSRKDRLEEHKKSKHLKIKPYQCDQCKFASTNAFKLGNHKRSIHGYVKCEMCNETFETNELRLDHETQVHGQKETCQICSEVCLTMRHLSKHTADKHCPLTMEGKLVCFYCKIEFKESRIISLHILNKHFNQPLYPCSQCDKGFDTKSKLGIHVQAKHSDERNYQCDKCAKSFKTLTSLQIHISNMHEEPNNVECKECGKIFKNKQYLRTHLAQGPHSGYVKTAIICDDCGKTFLSKDTYKVHCLRKHSDATEREKHLFKCSHPDCNYSTFYNGHLKKHFKAVHLKEKGNYQCSFCPKRFAGKKILEDHTNGVHLNLKPYQCEKCEFATAYRSIFTEHQRVAHGNQKFDCPHCNHSARYKGNLDKHINNVHKNVQTILTDKNIM